MKQCIGLALAAALAAVPQAAPAQGGRHMFSVTNATSHTLACGVSRRGSAKTEVVVLSPGEEWNLAAESSRPRTWVCESPALTTRYRLHSGTRYRLVERDESRIVLVVADRG